MDRNCFNKIRNANQLRQSKHCFAVEPRVLFLRFESCCQLQKGRATAIIATMLSTNLRATMVVAILVARRGAGNAEQGGKIFKTGGHRREIIL